MMTVFTAACVQMNSTDDMNHNLERACEMITLAAQQGANFVTTPECVALMATNHEQTLELAKNNIRLKVLERFSTLAKNLNIHLLIGSLPTAHETEGEKVYNCSYLIDAEGNVSHDYNKIHLYHAELPDGSVYREADRYHAGETATLAETPWGTLGMTICYDLRFPHLYRHLALQGAGLLAVPAAFIFTTGRVHWEVLLRARAIENASFVFAPAQVGLDCKGRKTYGHSLIISPWGEILAEAGEEEEIILAEIDTTLIKQCRDTIPSLENDNFKIEL
jgi:predicted amidohydrolase